MLDELAPLPARGDTLHELAARVGDLTTELVALAERAVALAAALELAAYTYDTEEDPSE